MSNPTTPRQNLAAAIAGLREFETDLAEAQRAEEEARSARRKTRDALYAARDRMDSINQSWTGRPISWDDKLTQSEMLKVGQSDVDLATAADIPTAKVLAEATVQRGMIEGREHLTHAKIKEAALAVAQTEAEPTVQALLKDFNAAVAAIVKPALLLHWMVVNKVSTDPAATAVYNLLHTNLIAWPALERGTKNPWPDALTRLEKNAEEKLP